MRPLCVCVIASALAIVLLCQQAVSQPLEEMTRLQVPYIRAGPVWSLNPSAIANESGIMMNTSSLAATNNAAIAISFAPAGINTIGSFHLAPAIAQTSSRTISCDQSYFYQGV